MKEPTQHTKEILFYLQQQPMYFLDVQGGYGACCDICYISRGRFCIQTNRQEDRYHLFLCHKCLFEHFGNKIKRFYYFIKN